MERGIERVRLYILEAPLAGVFRIAYSSSASARTLVVELVAGGVSGWGEAAPAPRVTGEDLEASRGYISSLAPRLLGARVPGGLGRLLDLIHSGAPGAPAARAALEAAVLDLSARLAGVSADVLLGGRRRGCLVTDYTVPLPPRGVAEEVAARTGRGWERFAAYVEYLVGLRGSPPEGCSLPVPPVQGFTVLKVKAGLGDPRLDASLVEAVAEASRGRARIRVDANQAWGVKEAVRIVRRLEARLGGLLELVEQPTPAQHPEALAEVSRRVETPVAADESAVTLEQVARLARLGYVDAVNIKVAKVGGPLQASKAAAVLEAHGVDAMWGCMVETGLGVAQALHPALASPATRFVDLDSPLFLKTPAASPAPAYRRTSSGVCVEPHDAPGLGAEPRRELLSLLGEWRA